MKKIMLSTKANTLVSLAPLLKKASVDKYFITTEKEWISSKINIVDLIKKRFNKKKIIVRSSALCEDSKKISNAGTFNSILNVDSSNKKDILNAVTKVIRSYQTKNSSHPNNQILVQEQTINILLSGTILTSTYDRAPYFVINYSNSKDTSIVTSGKESKSIKILRSTKLKDIPILFRQLKEVICEIERIISPNIPLDIEFAIKKNKKIVIFQVRPLVIKKSLFLDNKKILELIRHLKNKFGRLSRERKHIPGKITYFSDMTDWNPSEMIGDSPKPLAYSLYDYLITRNIWHKAKATLGYSNVNPAKLVFLFGNKPYVDIRSNFNAFIPAQIPNKLKNKLISFFLKKLQNNPHLQDKVEFEILYTCYDFSFNIRVKELLKEGFKKKEVQILKRELIKITNDLLKSDLIDQDLKINNKMDCYRKNIKERLHSSKLKNSLKLLYLCKNYGTLQFARITRLSFIGNCLLKSLVKENIITFNQYNKFNSSIDTVLTEFTHDVSLLIQNKISKKNFLNRYGHLRPGTYDLTISRYDHNPQYFSNLTDKMESFPKNKFELASEKHKKITRLLKNHKIKIDSKSLFKFIKKSIKAREYSKFLFTKRLSDSLELISQTGNDLGFSKNDLSYLELCNLKKALKMNKDEIKKYWKSIILKNKQKYKINSYLSLPPILFSKKDFNVVTHYKAKPNYITNRKCGPRI